MQNLIILSLLLGGLLNFASTEETTVSPSLVKQARKIQNYCKKESNISQELLEQTRKNIYVNDPTVKCFLKCLLDTCGMMSSDNIITMEPLQLMAPEEIYLEFARIEKICGTKPGSDACEIAYNTAVCYVENNSKNYKMVL